MLGLIGMGARTNRDQQAALNAPDADYQARIDDFTARLLARRECREAARQMIGNTRPIDALMAYTSAAHELATRLPQSWMPGQLDEEWTQLRFLISVISDLAHSGLLVEQTVKVNRNHYAMVRAARGWRQVEGGYDE